mmetsp:Transcript_117606/g.374695  ORF Transcript_117606/g.374695 Transcript_117606/m.374695 type:complete len:305 (+) Transcript_117606:264-1178(+)
MPSPPREAAHACAATKSSRFAMNSASSTLAGRCALPLTSSRPEASAKGVGKLIMISFTGPPYAAATTSKAVLALLCRCCKRSGGTRQRLATAVAKPIQCAEASTARTEHEGSAKAMPRLDTPKPQPKSRTKGGLDPSGPTTARFSASTACSAAPDPDGATQRRPCRVECRKSHRRGRSESSEKMPSSRSRRVLEPSKPPPCRSSTAARPKSRGQSCGRRPAAAQRSASWAAASGGVRLAVRSSSSAAPSASSPKSSTLSEPASAIVSATSECCRPCSTGREGGAELKRSKIAAAAQVAANSTSA